MSRRWRGRFGGPLPEGLELISTKRGPFLRGEFFGDGLPAGRWLRLPDPRAARMGPSEFVEFLKAAGDIENVGTDQIRGEPSVHLEGPLDLEAVVKETGSEVARLFADQPVFEEMELELDAWISKHSGRINRMLLIGTHPEVEGTLEISGDFSAYGVSLEESEAPDPSTVLVR